MKRLTEDFNRRTYEKARRLKAGCKKIIGSTTCISGCPYKPYCTGLRNYCHEELEPAKVKTSELGKIIEDAEATGYVNARDWINSYRLINNK